MKQNSCSRTKKKKYIFSLFQTCRERILESMERWYFICVMYLAMQSNGANFMEFYSTLVKLWVVKVLHFLREPEADYKTFGSADPLFDWFNLRLLYCVCVGLLHFGVWFWVLVKTLHVVLNSIHRSLCWKAWRGQTVKFLLQPLIFIFTQVVLIFAYCRQSSACGIFSTF